MKKLIIYKKQILLGFIILGFLSINFTLVFNKKLKAQIYNLAHSPFRELKGIVVSNFKKNEPIKIIKIKTNEGLFLEVYSAKKSSIQTFFTKIKLPDSNDGYFQFSSKSSNLALSDINQDGIPDIIAVSFDKNQKGHLNIYNFDYKNKTLVFLGRK